MEITEYLTICIQSKIPVTFLKYGDGEFNAIFNPYGCNCDRDVYTQKLSIALKQSFKYTVEKNHNAFIGLWHNIETKQRFESMTNSNVKWADYHTIIIADNDDNNTKKAILYKTIKDSKLKKIIVCNRLLIKSKMLLNIDNHIFVPFNNWFDNEFITILEELKKIIGTESNFILITCCGMAAKVLIAELHKYFPSGIYLDFGSALDRICTKRESRGWKYSYEYLTTLLKDCLPDDWEDVKYNDIYIESSKKLGVHLY